MEAPTQSYLVCATPRSGSTLLCELLSNTNVAGRPAEYFERLYATNLPRQPREYFESLYDPQVHALLAESDTGVPESPEAFAQRLGDALKDGTTPNGVFASKLMWGYLPDLLLHLRDQPATQGLKPAAALREAFGDPHYVYVKRRDKLAQAVSLWTAVQTAQWREEGDGAHTHDPEYSFAGIDHLVSQLTGQEAAWARWFASANIEPVTVVYEDLITDQSGVVLDVLSRLGISTDGVEVPEPQMRRQSGERSQDWARRYDDERRAVV